MTKEEIIRKEKIKENIKDFLLATLTVSLCFAFGIGMVLFVISILK